MLGHVSQINTQRISVYIYIFIFPNELSRYNRKPNFGKDFKQKELCFVWLLNWTKKWLLLIQTIPKNLTEVDWAILGDTVAKFESLD